MFCSDRPKNHQADPSGYWADDTYVWLYDDLKKGPDDNPTIGIILYAEKNEVIARYSVLKDSQQLFTSKYQMTLPTQEELEAYIQNERRRIEER